MRLRTASVPLLALALTLVLTASAGAELRINEVVASNGNSLLDEDGDSPDWIELYNSGPDAVDLTGWSLSDDPALAARWFFPSLVVAADSYQIVFASDKNRRDPNGTLHTSFRLSGSGEFLALVDPSGAVAMDIGSSTGGFTDVLLKGGAEHVFAVDSGTNQLAWKLRQDERVTVHAFFSASTRSASRFRLISSRSILRFSVSL